MKSTTKSRLYLNSILQQYTTSDELTKEDYQEIVRLENHKLNHELCVQQQENFEIKRELAKYKTVIHVLLIGVVASICILLVA